MTRSHNQCLTTRKRGSCIFCPEGHRKIYLACDIWQTEFIIFMKYPTIIQSYSHKLTHGYCMDRNLGSFLDRNMNGFDMHQCSCYLSLPVTDASILRARDMVWLLYTISNTCEDLYKIVSLPCSHSCILPIPIFKSCSETFVLSNYLKEGNFRYTSVMATASHSRWFLEWDK